MKISIFSFNFGFFFQEFTITSDQVVFIGNFQKAPVHRLYKEVRKKILKHFSLIQHQRKDISYENRLF